MPTDNDTAKPWGGRFTEATDQFVEAFTESVSFDRRLAPYDIEGSVAHVRMLARVGVLTDAECEAICTGLNDILMQIEAGEFAWKQELEDVHMNIEAALVQQVGEVGKKVHSGRSRNDQVATDLRLYLRAEVAVLRALLVQNMQALVALAEQEAGAIMPGYTHLQGAQPITFGHHILAWYEMLKRDEQRLNDCLARINVLPLGAAALAGTRVPIDRALSAELLGFPAIAANSLDAVSDRDFVVEFCAAAALVMLHLSRFSEELVLWLSPAFGFIDIDDAFCTGSSIMPQKKNPDVAELVRGKTGRVYGDLTTILTIMKGQPLAYNRDNQEDKECLFDAVDTLKLCLQAYLKLLPSIQVKREVMHEAAQQGYLTATDLADYLTLKGVAFRDAHAIVGKTVQYALRQGKGLEQLELPELQQFHDGIDVHVYDYLRLQDSVAARDHAGGTAPAKVRAAAAEARRYLDSIRSKGNR
ncbi:MAG: argininosuccinate lyase [Gammaproteobacteria bacterium]|nr:argininosuccinate lyase [Gammaproteobacteria bacterium]MCY4281385.1 argininosuccinate lyase [Gammaproteobacteria bacterium]